MKLHSSTDVGRETLNQCYEDKMSGIIEPWNVDNKASQVGKGPRGSPRPNPVSTQHHLNPSPMAESGVPALPELQGCAHCPLGHSHSPTPPGPPSSSMPFPLVVAMLRLRMLWFIQPEVSESPICLLTAQDNTPPKYSPPEMSPGARLLQACIPQVPAADAGYVN